VAKFKAVNIVIVRLIIVRDPSPSERPILPYGAVQAWRVAL
jgi:hypothetical protein